MNDTTIRHEKGQPVTGPVFQNINLSPPSVTTYRGAHGHEFSRENNMSRGRSRILLRGWPKNKRGWQFGQRKSFYGRIQWDISLCFGKGAGNMTGNPVRDLTSLDLTRGGVGNSGLTLTAVDCTGTSSKSRPGNHCNLAQPLVYLKKS